jgi:aspartate racemase
MRLLAEIKQRRASPETSAGMCRLAEALTDRGAQAVIAGCTEIPLVLEQSMLNIPLFSSTDILAEATVEYALGRRDLNT